jgi:hypothetical protein
MTPFGLLLTPILQIATTTDQNGTTCFKAWCPAHDDGKCELSWKKGSGYTNPHSKLKTCFGGEVKLMTAYWAAYNAKSTGKSDIRNAIQQEAAGYTPEENVLNDWLTMIIIKNWSLNPVECKLHRNMCKHKTRFSCKQICMMMFLFGEVVETKVAKMLDKAKALGLYDGFTCNSIYYVTLYASFIEGEGDASFKKTTHCIILLGVSPMIAIKSSGNNDEDDEAANDNEEAGQEASYSHKFDAEHHIHHFGSILKAYNQEVKKLFVAFVSDNASVNCKTARLAGLPHLPCHNHTHALDIGK